MRPFGKFNIPKQTENEEYPLLPLRDLVIFPQTIMSVYITYKAGVAALEEALKRDYKLFAVCQKSAEVSSKEQKPARGGRGILPEELRGRCCRGALGFE